MDATTDGPSPSPPDDSGGRDPATGRFGGGNTFGQGNPHHKRVADLRSALLEAISPEDLRAILKKLIEQAKAGDVAAAKEVLDRIFGRATQPIEVGGSFPELTEDQQRRADEIVARADRIDD